MMAVWKDWGLDIILKEAYEKGVIMCGVSAGAICWFKEGVTDSWSEELKIMDCMGFVKGACCPHYDEEPLRRPSLSKFLIEGVMESCYAIDGGCALHIEDEQEYKAVVFAKEKNAYYVDLKNDKVQEQPYFRKEIF